MSHQVGIQRPFQHGPTTRPFGDLVLTAMDQITLRIRIRIALPADGSVADKYVISKMNSKLLLFFVK